MSNRSFFRHLNILLWKNWLIKRRTWVTTLAEIALPVLIMAVIVGIRSIIEVDDYPQSNQAINTIPYDEQQVVNFLLTYPRGRSQPNTQKIVFAAPQSVDLTPIIGNFTLRYPLLAPSIISLNEGENGYVNDYIQEYLRSGSYGLDGNPYWCAVVVVDQIGQPINQYQWSYTVRLNSSGNAQQLGLFNPQQVDEVNDQHYLLEDNWSIYVTNGEIFFQSFMETYALMYETSTRNPSINQWPTRQLTVRPFPTPAYTVDNFGTIAGSFLGLIFIIVFLWPVTRIIKLLVEEKETRIKEGMRMMGLNDTTLWLSWLITYFIIFIITSILITGITANNAFQHSDKALIFFFFLLSQLAFFSFCYLVSTMFSNSRMASTFGALVFLGTFFPYYAVFGSDTASGTKTVACLSAPLCFGLGVNNIFEREAVQVGVNNNNAAENFNNLSYTAVMGMLVFDMLFYLILGLYLGKVFPGQYGVPLPWYFPVMPSYYRKAKPAPIHASNEGVSQFVEQGIAEPIHFDQNDPDHQLGVRINKLRKEFQIDKGAPPFVAVDDLSLDLYTGQITALLGHNGAGKTTTMSILSGLIPPTSGSAQILGLDLATQLDAIRSKLGVCPQHNILFPLLTVEEHLELYAVIKGVPRKEVKAAVQLMIKEVGLEEKAKVQSRSLSGGMQRKLSVGIAFIGDSQLVFLDEPTSGMDPYSRRFTWDVIKKHKPGRVIVLCSHFMDECDQLGDRIAIMASGQLQTVGSSLFLKSRFGVGYTMTLMKQEGADEKAITHSVMSHVPNAELTHSHANEMAFKLPLAETANFPDMFDDLSAHNKAWGIDSYGISVTTLEEVFLRVGHLAKNHPAGTERQPSIHGIKTDHENGITRVNVAEKSTTPSFSGENDGTVKSPVSSGSMEHHVHKDFLAVEYDTTSNVTVRHIRALLIKRWQNAKRNRKSWCWIVLIPFLVMLVFLGIIVAIKTKQPDPFIPTNIMFNQPNLVDYAISGPVNRDILPLVNSTGSLMVNRSSSIQTADQMADFLYQDFQTRELSQYGAYLYSGQFPVGPSIAQPLSDNLTLMVNTTANYGIPFYYNLYNQAVYRSMTNQPNAGMTLALHPFPTTANTEQLMSSITSIIIAIALAFVPANFAYWVVKERFVKTKHLQFISGVSAFEWWTANYLWDFVFGLIPICLVMLSLAIYGIDELIGDNAGASILVLLLYLTSIIPFTYLASFLFNSPTSSQNVLLIVYILIGAFLLIVSVLLSIISSTKDIQKKVVFAFRLFPSFCMGEAFTNLLTRTSTTATSGAPRGIWDMDVVGWPLIFMAWESVVYSIIVLVIEYIQASPVLFTWFSKSVGSHKVDNAKEDADVKAERQRLMALQGADPAKLDMITMFGLRKVYAGPKIAVQDLWLSVPEGECLGFLGINGAGKTTTMKMLTNDVYPTDGDAFLGGLSVMTQQQEVRRLIGYCPQFDALIGTLTGREQLALFARIKGVKESVLPEYVQGVINELGLQAGIADRPCKGYSGGNKRKLCVGMALIGNPKIVFLDEPSTGMDPQSRRYMWDLISRTMKGRSVLLTSHLMEEIEALCQRITIMVGGSMRCIGTAQHLKSRYGDGYQLDATLPPDQHERLLVMLNEQYPNARILEQQDQLLRVEIPRSHSDTSKKTVSIASVFRTMEQAKSHFQIREYAVSETSLDQIFVRFAATQDEEKGQAGGLKRYDENSRRPSQSGVAGVNQVEDNQQNGQNGSAQNGQNGHV